MKNLEQRNSGTTPENQTNRKLVEYQPSLAKLQGGDPNEWRTWVDSRTPSLFKRAVRLTRDPDVAEELVQDTWTKVIANVDKFKDSVGSLNGLVGLMLDRMVVDYWRDPDRRRIVVAPPEDMTIIASKQSAPDNPEEKVIQKVTEDWLYKVIKTLAPHHREAILYDMAELSYEEIAEMTKNGSKTPIATLKSRRWQARKALRDTLRNPKSTDVKALEKTNTPKRKETKSQADQIMAMVKKGLPLGTIAAKFTITEEAVRQTIIDDSLRD